jgi:hypothetical protein
MLYFFLLFFHLAYAHGGRTDSKGGHNGPTGYHYHSSSSSSSSDSNSATHLVYNTPQFKYPHIVKKNCNSLNTIKSIDTCIIILEDLQDLEKKKYVQLNKTSDLETHSGKIKEYEFTLMQLDALREEKVATRSVFVSLGIGIAVLFITALALG